MAHALTEQELLQFSTGELDSLEFKSSRIFRADMKPSEVNQSLETIAKAVSAMANSGGGRIILGASDESEPGQVVIDGDVPWAFKGATIKEWLTNVIPPLVDPELRGLNVFPVTPAETDSEIGEGRAVIVIEIPDSEDAPHQARDNRYYIRVGAKSKPIGNRIVMDIANRRKHPVIEVRPQVNGYGINRELELSVVNIGKITARLIIGEIYIWPPEVSDHPLSSTLGPIPQNPFVRIGEEAKILPINNAGMTDVLDSHKQVILTRRMPLHPGRSMVKRTNLLVKNRNETAVIGWRINVDDAPAFEGYIRVNEIPAKT